MSTDFKYKYIYNRDDKDYDIASGMLNSLFTTYGYCVDPGARIPVSLTSDNIEKLKILATKCGDAVLLRTINLVSNAKTLSPRMVNDTLMHEITFNEKRRFKHLTSFNRDQTIKVLKTILNVGMYLAGWKGSEEPYIITPRDVYDTVRVELKIFPLIQSLHTNPLYLLLKNFPIIGYFKAAGASVKPFVIDAKLNIDHCLNQISHGLNQQINNMSLQQLASYLICTSYYYITSVCDTPLPMVELLIHNLSL